MEKILRIEETVFRTGGNYLDGYVGFQIITDQQTIKVGISDVQSCCESWGYLITNDNIDDFIGSELLNIIRVDTALNNKKIEEIESLDCGGAMFINFETTKGLFQIVVYNAHNGYYGHGAVLISKQLNHETCL
jgi:hypothetical protein